MRKGRRSISFHTDAGTCASGQAQDWGAPDTADDTADEPAGAAADEGPGKPTSGVADMDRGESACNEKS